jgi:hypothetical protein
MNPGARTAPAVTDTTNPQQVARAQRKQRDRVKTDTALMRHQLSTYEGRQFVWRELERHGVFEDISGPDAIVHRLLGRRAEALRLLREAGVHGELFNQMWVEGRARNESARRDAAAQAMDDQAEADDVK